MEIGNKIPTFSIICPTYNRSKLLARAIVSVLRQTYTDFELIIVNDGSTDDTSYIMSKFKDGRIVFAEHTKNRGINAARNTAYKLVKGRYVALLDDDDELAPYALQLAFFKFTSVSPPKVKLLFFNCLDVETGTISGRLLPNSKIIKYNDLLSQKLRGDYWIVIERSILPKGKVFDEGSGGAEYTWLRLLKENDAYYCKSVAYFAYRKHNFGRITNSRSWQKREFNAQKIINEFGEDMKNLCPKVYSKQLAILGFYQVINNRTKQARVNLFVSIRTRVSTYAFVLLFFTFFGSNQGLLLIYSAMKKTFEKSHF